LRFKPGFGGAVEEDNSECEPEPAEARRKSHEGNDVKKVKEVKETTKAKLSAW
jgi:hypothetical protein